MNPGAIDFYRYQPNQAFNQRLNLVTDSFQVLSAHLLLAIQYNQIGLTADHLIDSMPVMLACGTHAKRGRLTREMAKTGFCATKQIHFYCVCFDLVGQPQVAALPSPPHEWLLRKQHL